MSRTGKVATVCGAGRGRGRVADKSGSKGDDETFFGLRYYRRSVSPVLREAGRVRAAWFFSCCVADVENMERYKYE